MAKCLFSFSLIFFSSSSVLALVLYSIFSWYYGWYPYLHRSLARTKQTSLNIRAIPRMCVFFSTRKVFSISFIFCMFDSIQFKNSYQSMGILIHIRDRLELVELVVYLYQTLKVSARFLVRSSVGCFPNVR